MKKSPVSKQQQVKLREYLEKVIFPRLTDEQFYSLVRKGEEKCATTA